MGDGKGGIPSPPAPPYLIPQSAPSLPRRLSARGVDGALPDEGEMLSYVTRINTLVESQKRGEGVFREVYPLLVLLCNE